MSIIKRLLGIKKEGAQSPNQPQVVEREKPEVKTTVIVFNAVGQEIARYKNVTDITSDKSSVDIETEDYEELLHFNSDCWVEVIDDGK